ncbi:hypothetical protein ATG_08940 [Desulfurococcaceae archaeon AG1]|jgi:hypothetical protein|nr:MAG: hypothetical protein DJ555_04770 [Desulfurococcaceae archaeon]GAY25691.1 hypothetical protein ATG_08940 [Desulfurococcaceae archaeon AG1]
MGMFRDHIYPIISGIIIGIVGGVLGLDWLWISILIAIPLAILSPNSARAGAINSIIASLVVFTAPIITRISMDPRTMRMLDILSSITGLSWQVIIAIPIIVYIVISLLACIAIISMKRVTIELRTKRIG